MKKGKVVYLNGASSSGKTTIARSFRLQTEQPYLYLGLDTFINMIPLGYFGQTEEASEYMQQKIYVDSEGYDLVSTHYGPKGMGLIRTMYKTVTNLAEENMDVVFDDVYWDMKLPAEIMKNVEVYLVNVYAPLDVLVEREKNRTVRANGLARWHFPKIYTPDRVYDLEIDTSKLNPEESVIEINKMLEGGKPTAFKKILL
jgi:chloramphenicol 3-O phosphotransferase